MCGIIGSFSKEKIIELAILNEERGNKAFSFSIFDDWFKLHKIFRKVGKFDENFMKRELYGSYFILHIQSPTKITEITPDLIHPASFEENLLWHNGMILDNCLKNLKTQLKEKTDWDTQIILTGLLKEGYNFLQKIEGSFACVYYNNGKINLFRNKIVPLYVDSELNISSSKFENSKEIESNMVYQIDFKNKQLIKVDKFENDHNPYNF